VTDSGSRVGAEIGVRLGVVRGAYVASGFAMAVLGVVLDGLELKKIILIPSAMITVLMRARRTFKLTAAATDRAKIATRRSTPKTSLTNEVIDSMTFSPPFQIIFHRQRGG
jgi:hypothetical protein